MNDELTIQKRIRVLSIRSINPIGHGGCIFYGAAIGEDGRSEGNEHFVVCVPNRLHITPPVEIGQWWDVSGTLSIFIREYNGLRIHERQIDAADARLVLPCGRHIITLLAHGERFAGIGISKAKSLWETYGEQLYELLEQGRVDLLVSVQGISKVTANAMVSAWKAYGDCTLIQLLHSYGIPRMTSEHAIDHFEGKLEEALTEDPYRLLSFCGSWRSVDSLAMNYYHIPAYDHRRLAGATEEVLYRLFDEGHTAPTEHLVMQRLRSLLKNVSGSPTSLATTALIQAQTMGTVVRIDPSVRFQQMGAWVMESTIARTMTQRLIPLPPDLLPPIYPAGAPGAYEVAPGSNMALAYPGVELTDEQVDAIRLVLNHRFALVSGGAGVGKTTLLKALYCHYDNAGLEVIQASIAGRAAQRMKEATLRSARTLASLLYSKDMKQAGDAPIVVVIDEASMLDVITMYRLCQALPQNARLILVGDAGQLMPVGPGLVFHELIDDPRIPHACLTKIMRHGNEIATFAQAIRRGVWPEVSHNDASSVAFLANDDQAAQQVADRIVELYRRAPESTQILCSLRNGVLGVRSLNLMCQAATRYNAAHLFIWNAAEAGYVDTGLRLGDPVVCTKNLWDRGVLNGSLGRVSAIEDEPFPLLDEDGQVCGYAMAWIDWDDGEKRPVTEELIAHLELAYALTIHKAQGSQWPIVVVPVIPSRLLDRSLLYTAATRAQHQVILLGDESVARRAVITPPRSKIRHTALRHHLDENFARIEGFTSPILSPP